MHTSEERVTNSVPAPAAAPVHAGHSEAPRSSALPRPAAPIEPPTTDIQPPSRPVEKINVTVGGNGAPRAEVRFTHRNGTIEMAVRTPDAEVAQSLRAALPELGSTLEAHGFRSEIRPEGSAGVSRTEAKPDDHDSGGHGQRGRSDEWGQHNQERRQRRHFEREEYD
jgi:hypothetical protein